MCQYRFSPLSDVNIRFVVIIIDARTISLLKLNLAYNILILRYIVVIMIFHVNINPLNEIHMPMLTIT